MSDFAMGIIVAHNRPPGDPNPSKQDITTTQQLIAAGREHYSFAASGMMLPRILNRD